MSDDRPAVATTTRVGEWIAVTGCGDGALVTRVEVTVTRVEALVAVDACAVLGCGEDCPCRQQHGRQVFSTGQPIDLVEVAPGRFEWVRP